MQRCQDWISPLRVHRHMITFGKCFTSNKLNDLVLNNTTSEYYSGIIKEEDWWYELCNLCCHHRMGWLLLSWWNRGRQIPIFKASRKADVLVATKNEHQQYRSSFTNESVERMRKGKYEYLSFWWRNKSRFVHRQWQGRWSKLPDNSIGKMHKVQERRCATPYSFENRDRLPYLIDSHASEIAKAKDSANWEQSRLLELPKCSLSY